MLTIFFSYDYFDINYFSDPLELSLKKESINTITALIIFIISINITSCKEAMMILVMVSELSKCIKQELKSDPKNMISDTVFINSILLITFNNLYFTFDGDKRKIY